MKRLLKLLPFVLLVMSTGGNTFAEEKVNVVKQGTIRGRIVDTSKQILPGASIYIEKLHTGVTSDINGYYTFANLTPGTYTVKVSYVLLACRNANHHPCRKDTRKRRDTQ